MPPASDIQDSTAADSQTIDTSVYQNLPAGGDTGHVWHQEYFPVLLIAAIVVIVGLFATAYGYRRWRRKHSENDGPEGSSSASSHVPSQICLYPPAKPFINSATLAVQPLTECQGSNYLDSETPLVLSPCHTPVNITPVHTPLSTPPLRLKKGLLERRGSNASLVLELAPPKPENQAGRSASPREISAEKYLNSAGCRLSRKQLRNSLKDVKALHQEFWDIPLNYCKKVVVPGSVTKNRYPTIIPNENSRVTLPEINGDVLSGYINANYIRGYGGEPHSYIATQGPMPHTVADFWRMIWQDKPPVIIMITKLKEQNKEKCDNYVPECNAVYNDIDITVTSSTQCQGYILRIITMKYNNQYHSLRHYWYTAWTDHTAPDAARQVLALVQEVDKYHHNPHTHKPNGPIVVHCSAGIGRTGSFIATSIGVQQLKQEYMVDILGIVCSMRIDRGGLVQTNEQYEFIHQALALYEKELAPTPGATPVSAEITDTLLTPSVK